MLMYVAYKKYDSLVLLLLSWAYDGELLDQSFLIVIYHDVGVGGDLVQVGMLIFSTQLHNKTV